MDIEYTGRQSTITKKLKSMTEEGLEPVSKMVGSAFSVHVIFTTEKYRHCSEITLKTRTYKLVAKCEATEMVVALADALDKVEQQAVRQKQKTTTINKTMITTATTPRTIVRRLGWNWITGWGGTLTSSLSTDRNENAAAPGMNRRMRVSSRKE